MNEKKMVEIMRKIEQSAEEIKIPKELEPDQIKEMLSDQKKKKKHVMARHMAEVAAAVALAIVIGGSSVYGFVTNQKKSKSMEDAQTMETENTTRTAEPKKKKVGSYQLAENYNDVYNAVSYMEDERLIQGVQGAVNGGIASSKEAYKYTNITDMAVQESGSVEESDETLEDRSGDSDYSKTNLQVAGVDESDIIKNDGNYLYLQENDRIVIIDIRNKKMRLAAKLKTELGADDAIEDMYMDGNSLYLIVQKYETEISDENLQKKEDEEEIETYMGYEGELMLTDTIASLELQTYDITDRSNVHLVGSVTMDGNYHTSRKNGDYIYLFSEKYIAGISKKQKEELIPRVNGKKAEADCFYVQDHAESELIAASVNVKKPDEIVDKMVVMNANMQVYMGTESICLYGENYNDYHYNESGTASHTTLTRFRYKDGYMNAVAATSVKGTIQDPFAISEENGVMRVLTTDWKSSSENQLFLLDENLNLLGSLRNIAKGEEIYAARYIGNIAYFITYHNTDPLFAVDISDPKNPKMLGQLKVTGFSDYLHPYGENLLLGIGYETDPKTSETLGIKLTMFDTSNPKKLKVLDTVKLKGDWCPAAENYKSVLADSSKNLIGFQTISWGDTDSSKYYVYSWDGKQFVKKFEKKLSESECRGYMDPRGEYAGNTFYLVSSTNRGFRIRSYDMNKKYKKLDVLDAR